MMAHSRRSVLSLLAAGATVAVTPRIAWSADPGVTKDKIVLGSFLPLQSGLAAGATQMKEGMRRLLPLRQRMRAA